MSVDEVSLGRIMEQAIRSHQQGKLAEAESFYRQIIQASPDHPDALHLLGVIAYQVGNSKAAIDLISRAIAKNDSVAEYHNNLGNAQRQAGKPEEAVRSFVNALRLAPRFAEAHNNLGLALRDLGRAAEALKSFEAARRLQPCLPEIHNNLGLALRDLGRVDGSVRSFRKALSLRSDYAEALSNLGAAMQALGKRDEAERYYQRALQANPRLAQAHANLGSLRKEQGQIDEAARSLGEALRLEPSLPEALVNLGSLLQEQGSLTEAGAYYERALTLRPGLIAARWVRCMAHIEILPEDYEGLQSSRERYRRALEELASSLDLSDTSTLQAAAQAVGGALPFFLSYQGSCDRDLQILYGKLVHRVLAARYPQWAREVSPPPLAPGEALRVGLVSAYFHYHSNWKIPISGWVENLDRKRFRLFGYYTGSRHDGETKRARGAFHEWREGPLRMEEWCRTIRSDRLHVLIYPELGMNAVSLRLAALRLAPVQCTSWGHPETSGLPTIDYFLSSDLMEPADGHQHYSEELIRLPNLSIHYTPPSHAPAEADRSFFGLRRDRPVFLCAQSLFKYLPQFDDAFPLIARQAGPCQFAFISFGRSGEVDARFLKRLDRTFGRHGLSAADHVVLISKLDPALYQALNRTCDVFLDSIGWSGCNSTLEALEAGLPVVTLPGSLMRGRHSLAFLRMMGMENTVGHDLDEYVAIAARLASDPVGRATARDQVLESRLRLYRDMECIRGLEFFLKNAAARA